MSTHNVKQQDPDQQGQVIADNLMCLVCGYNLRGLSHKGNCPECDHLIQKTITARLGMTKRELAALVFRVLAFWYMLRFITDFSAMVMQTLRGGPDWLFFSISALTFCALPVLLAWVWWKADLLSKFAIKVDGPISLCGRILPGDMLSVAMSIIGITYLIYGVIGGIWVLISFIPLGDRVFTHSFFTTAINLAIGSVVLLGARRITRCVLWLRTTGLRRDKNE